MIFSKAARAFPFRGGFALVVTLSLMILLTIVAVGLLSLSALSLRSSSQGEATAVARANARLALMMAIGELQKQLGPDSRISAPHDAGSAATGGQPNWTAVYDAWRTPADPVTPETPQSRGTPTFRGWLVSGTSGSTGEKTKLVGSKSLGSNPLPADEVSVSMQAVNVGNQKGRFAWWAADESVKAKVNAGLENPAGGAAASNPLLDAQSAPCVGYRAIAELAQFKWQPGQRSAAITNGAVDLAANLGNSGIGNLNHAVTVHSAGVLSDVRAGRLKRDLSNLLSRPIAQLENKPLYLANGRINRFVIDDSGSVSNAAGLPANASGANRWGINLEELHLFHQLHREVDWNTGKPRLVSKSSKEAIIQDRFYIYRKPVIDAICIILSLTADPDTAPGTYKMQGMLDAMVAISNPNDIPFILPSSVVPGIEMHSIPYRFQWNIRTASGTPKHTHTTSPVNRPFFKAKIRNGFTIEPGESAVFGSSVADTQARQSNLTRGFVPRGGVRIADTDWENGTGSGTNVGLRATGLKSDDTIDFSLLTAPSNFGAAGSGWILCPVNIANASAITDTIDLGAAKLDGGGTSTLNTAPINTYMLGPIKPSQQPRVQEFIGKPMPVMMMTLMPNVEKSRDDLLPPNAFPSRPFHFREPAISRADIEAETAALTYQSMQTSQWIAIAESMDYEFGNDRTMPAGAGGRNLYHGRAREVGLGGSFNVVKRRIPLSPPLSIGNFENAIACGLTQRFAAGPALNGYANNLPAIAKSIGNSWSNPFIASNSVYEGNYHDPSWMANTALWDSWFLSGIVDGRGVGNNPFLKDNRSPRAQFRNLVEATGTLRNKRLAYNRRQSVETALSELFDGETLKPSAINKLPKYLLIDGPFNVNSTSVEAWKAFLTSVREQELLKPDGSLSKCDHPFGTLGYAASQAASDPDGDWSGFPDLSDSEMEALAAKIVDEVKERGPFLSMADFVNRRPDSSNEAHKALGALQAAINKSGINGRYAGDDRDLTADDVPMLAGRNTLASETVPARSIGSAGLLSQGDVLSALGSQITVRGDTFVIRTYGDARDASGNKILARAWCEAVVQRFPEYVDPSNAPETTGTLTQANTTFGRKFDIISFRWLNPREIANDI